MAEHLGMLEQAVLIGLLRPQTELGKSGYGRAIHKEVEHRLQRPISAGAIYSTLDRLEAKGLVSSELGPGTPVRGGRPKRHYRVEAKGFRALTDVREATNTLWAGVRLPLRSRT